MAVQEADETGQEIIHELGKNREVLDGIRAKVCLSHHLLCNICVVYIALQVQFNFRSLC